MTTKPEVRNKPRQRIGVKSVYTTGEVSSICNVSQQTVIRCFDSGKLKGFRVPGSRFRRIPRESLLNFMKEHGIPLDTLETGRKRVLVVDDDIEVVEMFTELFQRRGHFEVQTARTGYDAGVMTESFRPDIMLLDFKLPDVNGNVVCRTIRNNANYQHMKIIMISGETDRDMIQGLLDAGADDFFKKPCDTAKVVERVDALLGM